MDSILTTIPLKMISDQPFSKDCKFLLAEKTRISQEGVFVAMITEVKRIGKSLTAEVKRFKPVDIKIKNISKVTTTESGKVTSVKLLGAEID